MVFDILALGEKSLCHLELEERRKKLEMFLKDLDIKDDIVELSKLIKLPSDDDALPNAIQAA